MTIGGIWFPINNIRRDKVLGPSGGSGAVDNGDGTYSFTDSLASMDSTDNLKFRVVTSERDKVGTYAFSH